MILHRRDVLRLAPAAALLPLLASCSHRKRGGDNPNTPLDSVGTGYRSGLQIIDGEAELIQGTSRYAFGLATSDGLLTGATATVYVGLDPSRPPQARVGGTPLTDAGLANRGLYVARVPFPTAGQYFVAVVATAPSGKWRGGTTVTVAKTSPSPIPGQRPPSIATPTTAKPLGASPLCSQRPHPCSMHAISLDAALRNGKPTVVVFAAPAFCQTELCGPDVSIVESVKATAGESINFIHVEAYRGATTPTNGRYAPAMAAFHFQTEPWLYVMDRRGVVSDRISGAFSAAEVVALLAKAGR